MKKYLAATTGMLLAAGLLSSPAQAAESTGLQASAPTAKSDYSKKKRNRFWRVVKQYDPLVKYAGKKTTIDLGVSTCDFLRSGADMYDLALLVYESDAGIAEDSMIAVIAAAPVVLCPDQAYKFE